MFRKILSSKGNMYSEDYEVISEIKKLADALGTTTDYLLNGEPPAQNEPPKNSDGNKGKIESWDVNPFWMYNPNDDLDLGFWGSVVEKAKRAAQSNDSDKKALIAGMLKMATDAITGAEKTPTPATPQPISAYNGDHSSYSGNVFNAGK